MRLRVHRIVNQRLGRYVFRPIFFEAVIMHFKRAVRFRR